MTYPSVKLETRPRGASLEYDLNPKILFVQIMIIIIINTPATLPRGFFRFLTLILEVCKNDVLAGRSRAQQQIRTGDLGHQRFISKVSFWFYVTLCSITFCTDKNVYKRQEFLPCVFPCNFH